MLEHIEKFHIVLIKPSKYDDDGYVIRFWKGVLPSNTLNVLHGLTEDIKRAARVRRPCRSKSPPSTRPQKKCQFTKSFAGASEPAPSCWFAWSACKPISFPAPWTWQEVQGRRHHRHHRRLSHQRHDQHAGRSGARHPGTFSRRHLRRFRRSRRKVGQAFSRIISTVN